MQTDQDTFVGELESNDEMDAPIVRVDAERTGTVIMDSCDRMVYLNPADALRLADMLREAAAKAGA